MMKVVHWNTHHGGVPIKQPGEVNQKLNVQGITDWLIRFQPDLVSLNELEQNDSYGNLDQLEHHRVALQVAQGRSWYSAWTTMTGGILNKGIGVGLLSSMPIPLATRKGLRGGRPALHAQQPWGELYTTHPDPDSATVRNVEFVELQFWVDQDGMTGPGSNETPTILCGDFNALPTSVEMAPWTLHLKDAWMEAKRLGTASSFTVDGATKGHRIDYVWYRGLSVVSVDVPDTSVGGLKQIFPSDHHPLVVTFK